MSNNFLIVTTESKLPLNYFNNHKIIGVERGCLDLINKEMHIDYAVSDFDHVENEELDLIKKHAKNFELLSSAKDYLDGEMAIKKAISLGATSITYVAKPSKRYDMNFSLVSLISRYDIKVLNEESVIFKVKKGESTLSFDQYQGYTFISFFPLKDCEITLTDFKYNVENYTGLKVSSITVNVQAVRV